MEENREVIKDISEWPEWGDWRIGRTLGGGSWTEVLEAVPNGGGPAVALKRLTRGAKRNADLAALFSEECRRLKETPPHPNLVRFHSQGRVEEREWVATELVQSQTLAEALIAQETAPGEQTAMSPMDISKIMVDIAAALSHLHELGIVHCDVNPTNILLPADGTAGAVLCDLGVATRAGDTANDRGSPGYMAPEQIVGSPVSPATDVFAFGIVWWEAVSHKRLFGGRPRELILGATLSAEIPAPNDPFYGDVISRALTRELADRPASMAQLMALLQTER